MKNIFLILVTALLLLGLAAGGYLLFHDTAPPQVALTPDAGAVGGATQFRLTLTDPGTGLAQYSVVARQGEKALTLAQEVLPDAPPDVVREFNIPPGALDEGPFALEVSANDASLANIGKGSEARAAYSFVLDSRPPAVSVLSMQHNITQGGSGLVVFSVNEDLEKAEVRAGGMTFPAYKLPDGRWAGMFAFPYSASKDDYTPLLAARDAAGNETLRPIPFYAKARKFRQDTINISDGFLESKAPEFQQFFPGVTDKLELFLKVNDDLRKQNRNTLLELGRSSEPQPLWDGVFQPMANAASMAGFGDARSYKHNGKNIDRQTHLGQDLASVRMAEVPAGNHGVVVAAEYMGIYGNNVIIDHGLGLMSMYSHLSSIAVAKGDTVTKGQIVGRTGVTGMAGGDHLHYAVLVAGLPVNPLEWWDASWIENNVDSKLRGER